jgi:osmotically-inducible protein OsmY
MTAVLSAPRTESVADALLANGHPELRQLSVIETEFEVELAGRVSSYYLKQVAQEAAREAIAGRRLNNRVVVG